jgi:hypothetical protein
MTKQQALALAKARRRRAEAEQPQLPSAGVPGVRGSLEGLLAPLPQQSGWARTPPPDVSASQTGESLLNVGAKGPRQLLGTMAGGTVAEPVAGLAGLGATLATGDAGMGTRVINATRSALTPSLGPEGVGSAKSLADAVPDWVKSAGKWASGKVDSSADFVADRFGPAAGAAVQTLPTAASLAASYGLSRAATAPNAVVKGSEEALIAAAPSKEALKGVSTSVYKAIDDMGVTISPGPYARLVDSLGAAVKRKGGHPKTTPKAMTALDEMVKSIDPLAPAPKLSDLDTYREIAKAAATSIEPRESMLGRMIMTKIDDFVDKAAVNKSLRGGGDPTQVGKMYAQARDLWGRQKRSDMITEAVEAAQRRASGIENGIRVELRKITNNPKKSRWFSKEELADLNTVVQGTKGANRAKALGRLAPMGGAGATNILTSMGGSGAGATVGSILAGPVGAAVGAMVPPAIGTVSRGLARRLTAGNAAFADAVVRAGKNGKKIASAYLRHTPKDKRSAEELGELLFKRDASALLSSDKLLLEAAEMASKAKAAATAGAIQGQGLQTGLLQSESTQ